MDERLCHDEQARQALLRDCEQTVDLLFAACTRARNFVAQCRNALCTRLGGHGRTHH